jgi:hypothetical protein
MQPVDRDQEDMIDLFTLPVVFVVAFALVC